MTHSKPVDQAQLRTNEPLSGHRRLSARLREGAPARRRMAADGLVHELDCGRDVFDLQREYIPIDMRWLVYGRIS